MARVARKERRFRVTGTWQLSDRVAELASTVEEVGILGLLLVDAKLLNDLDPLLRRLIEGLLRRQGAGHRLGNVATKGIGIFGRSFPIELRVANLHVLQSAIEVVARSCEILEN